MSGRFVGRQEAFGRPRYAGVAPPSQLRYVDSPRPHLRSGRGQVDRGRTRPAGASGTVWSKNNEDATTRGEGGGVCFGWLWLAPRVISFHVRVGLGPTAGPTAPGSSSSGPLRVDPSENTLPICREAYCMALISMAEPAAGEVRLHGGA